MDNHDFLTVACPHCLKTFSVPVPCGNRFCDVCSVSRRSAIRKRITYLINHVPKKPLYSLRHLTLTIPNQVDPSQMLSDMIASFRKLRQRKFWKSIVDGGCTVFEVTGHPGNWHVHIHCIVHSRYLPWKQLLKEWELVSPGRGVYVSKISEKDAVRYLTKYMTKPDTPQEEQVMISDFLKGRRLFSAFGSFYAINLDYVKPESVCSSCGKPGLFVLDFVRDFHGYSEMRSVTTPVLDNTS